MSRHLGGRGLRTAAVVAVLAVVGAACTSATTGGGNVQQEPRRGLPEVEVLNVQTGAAVALGELVPAGLPTLVWFWAPH